MTAPIPPEQVDAAARVASTLELWAKIGGSLLLLWGFLARVYKPLVLWRREHQAKVIREVLAPELRQLQHIITEEHGCAERLEGVVRALREIYGDHDKLIEIALDNRERLDENNDFLDALGFASRERRTDEDRRRLVDTMVKELAASRRERRRALDDSPNPPED